MPRDLDDYVLQQVNIFDQLKIRQLMRIKGYGGSMYADVQKRFARLASAEKEEDKLLFSMSLTHEKGLGGLTKVYILGPKGIARLKADSIHVPSRFRPKKIINTGDVSVDKWRHRLAVNDALISLIVWERNDPTVTRSSMLTELDIERSDQFPVALMLPTGEQLAYKPDAWATGTYHSREFYLSLEIERKGPRQGYGEARWKDKVRKMAAFFDWFDEKDSLYFPVCAMQGEDHQKTLLKWTAQTLQEIGDDTAAPHIRITGVLPECDDLFGGMHWYVPTVNRPVHLLEKVT